MLTRSLSTARRQVSVALAALVFLEALYFSMNRLGDLRTYVVETIALALAAGIVYFVALYALERAADHRAAFWLILAGALLFRLTLAPLAPTLSDDIYRYRFDGRVQRAGWNPYSVRPDDPRFAVMGDSRVISIPGHDTRSVYPPLAQLVFRLTWRFLPSPEAFKTPFMLADLLVVVLLAVWVRRAGARNSQLAIYAWNPLVVVEFAASGHNDSLALVAVVAATLLIIGRRRAVSTFLLAAAVLAKAFPAVLFPLWLRRAGWPRARLGWTSAGAAAALAAVCAWPYRSALWQMPATLDYYQSRWQANNASLFALLAWFSRSPDLALGLGVGVVAGLALWLAMRHGARAAPQPDELEEAARAARLLFGAVVLLGPNGYPWYFTWIVPFLCFSPISKYTLAWLLLTVLQFLSYHVLINYQAFGLWQWNTPMIWLTYAPFYALLVWAWLAPRRARAAPAP